MIYWYSIIRQRNCCHFCFCNIVSTETHYRHYFFLFVQISWWKCNSLEVVASTGVWLKRPLCCILSAARTAHHIAEYLNVHWLSVETGLLISFSLWALLQPTVDPVHLNALAVAAGGHRGHSDQLTEQQNTTLDDQHTISTAPPLLLIIIFILLHCRLTFTRF